MLVSTWKKCAPIKRNHLTRLVVFNSVARRELDVNLKENNQKEQNHT